MTNPDPTPSDEANPPPASRRAGRLLIRIAIVLVVLLLLLRAALPSVLASLIEREGSAALGVDVEVEDVELALFKGQVALSGLRIAQPHVDGLASDDDLLRLDRAEVTLAWGPTIDGVPTLASVQVDGPRVRLRRLADGSIDAERLGAKPAEAEAPEVEGEDEQAGEGDAPAEAPIVAGLQTLALRNLDFELSDASDADAPPVQLELALLKLDDARIDGEDFSLDHFELDLTSVDLGPFAALQLSVDAQIGDLSSRENHGFPVELRVAIVDSEPPAVVALAGDVSLFPLGFSGRFETRDLPLVPLARAANQPPYSDWLRAGDLDTTLSIELTSDDDNERAIGVNGRLAVDGLNIEDSEDEQEREVALAWKQFEIDLREARVEIGADGAVKSPPRIHLAGITLEEPDVFVTRGGELLPVASADAPAEDGNEEDSATSAEAAPAPVIQLDYVKIAKGRFAFADYTTKPRFRERFDDIDIEAARIDPRGQTISKLDVHIQHGEGALDVEGGVGAEQSLAIDLVDFALAPFNAYVLSLAGYVIEDGTLTLRSKVDQGKGSLSAKNAITLADLKVTEDGGGGFEDQFGMKLPMALALLRDHQGRIKLDVPIERKGQETDLGLGEIVVKALRTAFVGALASPLKLVTAVVPGGDKKRADLLIPFEPKSIEAPETADEILEPIVALLAERPMLAISLRGQVGPGDGEAESTDLDAIASQRAEKIRTRLIQNHALAESQIVLDPQVPVGKPGVKLALVPRPVEKAAEKAADATTASP